MSDKNKIIFVGVGLAIAAATTIVLLFLLGRERLPEVLQGNVDRPTTVIDAVVYERKGRIISISAEGTNVRIFSAEEGEFSFFLSESSVIETNGDLISARDLVVGMEIEATVERGIASSVRVKSIPPLAVISPARGSIPDIDFNIEGIAYAKGERVCLKLSNRRTGMVYEDGLSVPISAEKKFSIPISLATALDASSQDILDAVLSICGSDESISAEWGYYPGLTLRVKVYFLKNSCDNPHYVERVIIASRSSTRVAVEELLKGPSAKETLEGIFTSANPAERVRSIKVESNIVYWDFYPTIVNTVRCDVATLKSQITSTLEQFPIGEFVITIDGEKENPLN